MVSHLHDHASVYASRERALTVSPRRCACISKYAGGIGLSVHNIRATDSYIRGSNGTSNGIVPMLRVYNDTARYVDQGGQISASRGAAVPSLHSNASSS